MAVQEHRTENYWVTANNAGDARDRLIAHLARKEDDDCVFDDKEAAESKAAEARRYMLSTGDAVYAITLDVATC